jgi:hypothetical protein
MSGTIFGLGLSQRVKSTGKPESGWKLYLYEAGTSTPVVTYTDTALTAGNELPWPMLADASGTMVSFWVADGSYRVRGTSSNGGTIFFDLPSVLALGASSGAGGGGDTTDPNALLQTGDPIWRLKTGAMDGFVRMGGRTIGSATSGATERANADCENLHAYLWNNLSDSVAAVSGGRGISSAADWSANKAIVVPSMRDAAAFGLDDMGNTAAGGFAGLTFAVGDATTVGSVLGATTKALAIANLPAHDHTGSTSPLTTISGWLGVVSGSSTDNFGNSGTTITGYRSSQFTQIQVPSMGLTVSSQGSGTAFDKMPPARLGTWYIKL